MCAVSVIVGYMQHHIKVDGWRYNDFLLLQKIIKDVEKLDKLLGQLDCIDPKKAEYLQAINGILSHG